jgi:hypothetical protein
MKFHKLPQCVLLFFLLFLAPLSSPLRAQQTGEFHVGELSMIYIGLDHSGGYNLYSATSFVYRFLLNLSGFADTNFNTISGIVVTTFHGDINFNWTLNKQQLPRFIMGTLSSNKLLGELTVYKAVVVADGNIYDITNSVQGGFISDMKIDTKLPTEYLEGAGVDIADYNICPYKDLNLSTKEGVYLGINEGEVYFARVKIKGKEENFLIPQRLMYFFRDKQNFGKKIKFVLKKYRSFTSEFRCCGMEFGCEEEEAISDVIIVGK